jgi:hypothetical protein
MKDRVTLPNIRKERWRAIETSEENWRSVLRAQGPHRNSRKTPDTMERRGVKQRSPQNGRWEFPNGKGQRGPSTRDENPATSSL